MRFFNNLFKNSNEDKKSVEINTDGNQISTNSTIEELNRFFSLDLGIQGSKLYSATYFACMQIRCNAIAKLPIKVMKRNEKDFGTRVYSEHPLYELLKLRPNKFMTAHDFKWATEFMKLEYGNAFWLPIYERGKIKALYLLDSSKMTIFVDDTGIINNYLAVYYAYSDPKKGELLYTSDDILHFKNFSKDGIVGNSVKKYIYQTIENEMYASSVTHNRYKDGLQDPIIVEYIGDLNEAKQAKIKKKFANLGGAKNAGKVVPIPSEYRVQQLETKLVNSQFFEMQGLTARHIANAFGVKGFQLNDMEKNSYNNIETQNRAFYSDTLQNVLTEQEEEMEYKLLTTEERKDGVGILYNIDSILRSDLKTRYESYKIGISSSFLTPAEAREKENLPYKEGTDKLIVGNGASVFLDDLAKDMGI